jgi:hypothetical protein
MGIVHGNSLTVARRLHGPASVVWIVLVGVHVLFYLLAAAIVSGVVIGIATVPAQHHWVDQEGTRARAAHRCP